MEFLLQDESDMGAAAKALPWLRHWLVQALLGKLVKAGAWSQSTLGNYCRLISVGVEGCICPKSFACYDSPLLKWTGKR